MHEGNAAREATLADPVDLAGEPLAEGLVRPDVVERRDPLVERALLVGQRRRRDVLQLEAHVEVHPLVPAVVLRLTGPAANDFDAERHPPGRELREPAGAAQRRERRTVVAVDGPRQPVAVEQLLEHRPDVLSPRARHRAQREHVPAHRVAHRQRIAPRAVERAPPALEVDRPEVVRLDRRVVAGRGRKAARRPTVRARDEPCLPKNPARGRDRRDLVARVLPRQHGDDLLRPPAPMRLAQLNGRERELGRRHHRRAARTARLVDQTGQAALLVAVEPFVDRLSADPEFRGEVDLAFLASQGLQHQLLSDAHDGPFLPRHPARIASASEAPSAARRRCCHLCPDAGVSPMS